MKSRFLRWVPAVILASGLVLVQTIDAQQQIPLRQPLGDAVPMTILGFRGQDVVISEAEQRAAGMSSYVMRTYERDDAGFTLYVGYYEKQTGGNEIHSPRNCLPAAGWESISATTTSVVVDGVAMPLNRHVIQNGSQQALVLYWYQGRGRVAANEIKVKLELLRDAARYGRTEDTLVRIVVPMTAAEDEEALAHRVAASVIPMIDAALPALD